MSRLRKEAESEGSKMSVYYRVMLDKDNIVKVVKIENENESKYDQNLFITPQKFDIKAEAREMAVYWGAAMGMLVER